MFGIIKDLTADRFTPTQWDGSEQKVRFARQFIRFVNSDFQKSQFTHAFYVRLALTFGHIAHFNQHGFYKSCFQTTESKVRFLRMTLKHGCYGDPAFTYSDVERALQSWLNQNSILPKYERKLFDEQESAERAELARLQTKYAK